MGGKWLRLARLEIGTVVAFTKDPLGRSWLIGLGGRKDLLGKRVSGSNWVGPWLGNFGLKGC